MCVGDLMAWNMAPLIDPATGGSVIALPDTLEKALKGIRNVDLVIEGHGNVNTLAGLPRLRRVQSRAAERREGGR